MLLSEIKKLLDAGYLTENVDPGLDIKGACGSDMLGNVMTAVRKGTVVLSGLANVQTVRAAELAEASAIIFVWGKCPDRNILKMAEDAGIAVLGTDRSMFEACGILYAAGLRGVDGK